MNFRKYELIDAAKERGFLYHANSPAPGFFNSFVCDGGLLTVSKYPITDHNWHLYDTPPASDDALSMKGSLYVKIDLSSLGGHSLHIFSTHT